MATPQKKRRRAKILKKAHNILHGNVPKKYRRLVGPMTMERAEKFLDPFLKKNIK